MECGLNIPEVHVVIIIKPLTRLHDILQAFGRSGRLTVDGLKRALCYTLWEGENTLFFSRPTPIGGP